LGRGPAWERSFLAFLGAETPVSAWGQKSQRHLTNCVSSISSKKDHSKFNLEIVQDSWNDRLSSFMEKGVLVSKTYSLIKSPPVGWICTTATGK